jgi:hypothetical protein
MDIEAVLAERQKTYGDFSEVAEAAVAAEGAFFSCAGDIYTYMPTSYVVAFRMILLKLARISKGAPHQADSWIDIAGYATLIAKTIQARDGWD